MRTLSAILANVALFSSIALVPVVGGVILILFLFFPLFLLALVGVLAGLEHGTVRQHNPSMDPTAWRDGS